ncbi:hypothetical protein Lal_00001118 [Lupinus albus]|uniref:Uncharacterized protein n=1 Tax=Lupinus albus TaxID=3870 RepID=A0A6A4NUG1_LUPAL|nr:hypothetical protein Lalb_Chr18g0052921 [Lupinus albus]KAF1890985.1 hypothetical protein Lal_00001118 [Lupinus albus]
MENNKKKVGEYSSSSSSPTNFDHLFGPKDSSYTSSSSTSLFSSIFPHPSTVGGRDSRKQDTRDRNYAAPGNYGKDENSSGIYNKNSSANYQNETVEPSYYSSSIYYGGQENYSPRTRTTESHHPHVFKKDKDDDNPNGNDSNSASRGNWWQGSLYY